MKNTSVLTFIETKETLMLKLKAAICDDDTKHTQDIASKLEQYDVVHDANISYQAFDKPTELLHLYKTGERFDILFLDIEMEAINGLTLAEKIKEMDRHAIIIFISFYPSYMQASFRTHPFYYLVKPVSMENFTYAMDDVIHSINSDHRFMTILHTDTHEETINVKDIYFIEIADSKRQLLSFHFLDHIAESRGTLNDWADRLSEYGFFLCRRNTLVNLAHIHYFKNGTLVLDNGEQISLSRNKEREIKELYTKNVFRLKEL
jgi:DNA-binding LytR/AlgR family response regulator